MSWSVYVQNKSADEAKAAIAASTAPPSIADYLTAGVDGLVAKFGTDIAVSINANGHLTDGPGSYDPTTAAIEVKRVVLEEKAEEDPPA